jgi:3-oxoacyl-[acyl-carrier protein] reductase
MFRRCAAGLASAGLAGYHRLTFSSDDAKYSPPIALVTGAGGTLGGAAVRVLVQEGYKVVAVDITKDAMDPLVSEMNSGYGDLCVVPVALDVSDPVACAACARSVQTELGTVSVLVNNAGILSRNKCEATTPAEWDRVMSINGKSRRICFRS